MFRLEGKTALVTGAGGHLGQVMAKALADAGALVWLNGRNEKQLAALQATIRGAGGRSELAVFDITNSQAIEKGMSQIGEHGDALDIIVNNAYSGAAGTLDTIDLGEFGKAYEVAVTAAAGIVKQALPLLRKAGSGNASIINVSSMYGLVSPDLRVYETPQGSNPPHYGAAKAALLQLTRYLAVEYGREGIRVNAIAPGPFPSGQVQLDDPDFVKRLEARVPLGRIGNAHELAGPVVFLASDASSYVTGTTLVVDGGWTAW